MSFTETMDAIGRVVEAAGVAAILAGAVLTAVPFLRALAARDRVTEAYQAYRRGLGRSILLGLEFLIAADIIRTVAVAPTFENLGVLAILIAIRTGLSFSLEMELTGRLPWRRAEGEGGERSV